MVSSEKYSPLAADELEKIAMDALIQAADDLGYNGEGDVMHRLTKGSLRDYKEPLRYCVGHEFIYLWCRLYVLTQSF